MSIVKILGRTIGHCSQNGDRDVYNSVFYDFTPADGVNLPPMLDLTIDFEEGTFQHWQRTDLVTIYRLVSLDPPVFEQVNHAGVQGS